MKLLFRIKNKIVKEVKRKLQGINYISPDCNIEPSAQVYGSYLDGSIEVGERARINRATLTGNIKVGISSSLWGPNLDIYTRVNSVKIGNYCSIARNVAIQEYFHDYKRASSYYIIKNIFEDDFHEDLFSKGDITIGHDVWIGAGAVILSGVTIGNGAVIGANSVVTGDIPDFSIAAGSPAKVIKYRFPDDLIEKLKELEWWDWSFEKILANRDFFQGSFEQSKIENIR